MSRFRIGDWILDAAAGTLHSAGGSARIEPRVQAVLQLLIDSAGNVVSQETLLNEAWRGTHVAPVALARTISILRRALGDDVRSPRYIETVPKRGYRLIAAVEELPPLVAPSATTATDHRNSKRWLRRGLIAATITMAFWPHHGVTRAKPSVGRFEFRHDTRLGNETAYEHYARAVARDPNSADAHAGLARVFVFRANYLVDREHWAASALASARRAIEIDPTSARATIALAMANAQAGHLRDAARYYRLVLARHPADGPTCANLGRVLLANGRVADALRMYERFVALEPRSPYAYAHLAMGLAVAGYPRESGYAAGAALLLEPYDLDAQMMLVRIDLMQAQYDDGEARLTRLLEGHTDCAQCVVQLGLIDQLRGRPAAAAGRYRTALAMAPQLATAALRLVQVLQLSGASVEADRILGEVERVARDALARGSELSWPAWQLAAAAAIRGDRHSALQRYREAVANGRRDTAWDRWDPLFSALHSDPGFREAQEPGDREHQAALPVAERLRSTIGRVDRHVMR